MKNDNLKSPMPELEIIALENMLIDFPERPIQERMVRDIDALIEKGARQEDAVNWVFGNRRYYEIDENYGVYKDS